MTNALKPGSVIGIIGGGQLGQMLALAAARLGFQCHIYSDTADSPAMRVSAHSVTGSYDDLDKVRGFAKNVDVITYEFENVPLAAALAAQEAAPVRPGPKALEIAQDRLTEKTFIQDVAGVAVTPFYGVKNKFDLKRTVQRTSLPIVLKTRRFGYDGKGQHIIRREEELESAYESFAGKPLIAEAFVPFRREVSVIAARSITGETKAYPLTENIHKDHILHISNAPAKNDDGRAQALTLKIMDALDYVGVMAAEFFELTNGDLLVNEIAPRVHNSGHWTQDAGCCDQFEQHIRAITGWPLGSTAPLRAMQMLNLIGDDIAMAEKLAADPRAYIHLYGKKDVRPGRKMGHINQIID